MAHNVCCDSYRVYNITRIYYTIVHYIGVKYVMCVSMLFPGTVVERLGSFKRVMLRIALVSGNFE